MSETNEWLLITNSEVLFSIFCVLHSFLYILLTSLSIGLNGEVIAKKWSRMIVGKALVVVNAFGVMLQI